MEQQSRYIAELRNEIYTLKGQSSAESMVIHKNLEKVEENCKKAVEQNFNKHENSLILRDKIHREQSEKMLQMFQQVSRNQMSTIEVVLKENLLKICTHKAFVDSISNSMLSGIQKSLEQTFKKSLEEQLIPSYEKITHGMFQDMGKAFTAGTKEYTRAFDTYMKQYGAVQFQMTEFSGIVNQIPQQVRNMVMDGLHPHLQNNFQDLKARLDKLHSTFVNNLVAQVKAEIRYGFEQQKTSLEDSVLSVVQRSHAETPAPIVYDQREVIKELLANREINKAFHHALVGSDLALLEFTIEQADFSSVFTGETPCELEQSVLLSLIQQLTADMSKYNELKNR